MAEKAVKADELLPANRNFSISLAERVRAQEGLPAHITRKRAIEDFIENRLVLLVKQRARGASERELWAVAGEELERVNDLIDKHNRYYPIEANLPIDPRTGGSLDGAKPFERLEPVTREWLLALLAER